MNWTIEQALSFAPDTGSQKRAKALAKSAKWVSFNGTERALWGECKSSGSSPYSVQVDLQGPAFKCNCPSRQFPCKHALALFLFYVTNTDSFKAAPYPAIVQEWLDKRSIKTNAVAQVPKEDRDEEEEKKKDAAKNKRLEKRLELMEGGMADFEIWLQDLLRQGFASIDGNDSYNFWNNMASRMVDSKVTGIANGLKAMPMLQNNTTDWHETMLTKLADMNLIVQGFKQKDKLSPLLQRQLFSVAGMNIKKEEVQEGKQIKDEWCVLGKIEGEQDDNLYFRRVWLWGTHTQQHALLLDFSFGNVGFGEQFSIGSIFKGAVIYYPSAIPIRALIHHKLPPVQQITTLDGHKDFDNFLDTYSKAIKHNPWMLDYPCTINNVIPIIEKEQLIFVDEANNIIPTIDLPNRLITWKLISLSGGLKLNIFGEWNGHALLPLSAAMDNRFIEI